MSNAQKYVLYDSMMFVWKQAVMKFHLNTETDLLGNFDAGIISNSKIEKTFMITLDHQLNFAEHSSQLCAKRAGNSLVWFTVLWV